MRIRATAGIVVAAMCATACDRTGADAATQPGAPPDAARLARGREERALWDAFDAARAAQAAGDERTAETRFRQVLDAQPEHPAALYALAGILHRGGRHDDALAVVQDLLRVDRPKTRALLLHAAIRSDAEALLASGRPESAPLPAWYDLDDAARAVAEAEAVNPEETGPHVARAVVEMLRGDAASADAALFRVLTIHPQHAEALVLSAVVRRERGDAEGARAALRAALAATLPRESHLPPGEGDTEASLAAARRTGTPRLRALAEALRVGGVAWPEDAPRAPPRSQVPNDLPPAGPEPLVLRLPGADGDGADEEIRARRAPERESLLSLFGVHHDGAGSFTVVRGGRDVTESCGLAGVAACAASLHAADVDGDGDLDVVVLPGRGAPARRDPPIVLVRGPGGTFTVHAGP